MRLQPKKTSVSVSLAVIAMTVGRVASTSAATVSIRVTVENLAPVNSVSLAPLRFGFGSGTFDAFDAGAPGFLLGYPSIADAPIVTVAEGGSGSNWLPA